MKETNCKHRGRQQIALVCSHIADAVDRHEQVGFYWGDDTDTGRPDAWCSACERDLVSLQGASSERWFIAAKFRIFCVTCWDDARRVCGGVKIEISPTSGSTQSASCHQRPAQIIGLISFLMFTAFTVGCLLDPKPNPIFVPIVFIGFALLGAYLFLYSGTVSVDHLGVTQSSMIGTFFIPWSSIDHVWTASGQLVLAGGGCRLALPGPDTWWGRGRSDVIAALNAHCEHRGIIPRERLPAIFMISRRTRVSQAPT